MNKNDAKFRRSMDFVFLAEGGTNNSPTDRGGLTKFGISSKTYPDLDIRNLTLEDAKDIYYLDYWKLTRSHVMSPDLALIVFDSAVNCGQPSSSRWLQNSCNKLGSKLKVDGVIGAHSILEVIKHSPGILLELVLADRLKRYSNLIQEHKDQHANIAGWINRIHMLINFMAINTISVYANDSRVSSTSSSPFINS